MLNSTSISSNTNGIVFTAPGHKPSISFVNVAVFKVEKDENGNTTNVVLVDELWVLQKPGVSLELLLSKNLPDNFNPEEIQFRELNRQYF